MRDHITLLINSNLYCAYYVRKRVFDVGFDTGTKCEFLVSGINITMHGFVVNISMNSHNCT